jgi:hypothetical protein
MGKIEAVEDRVREVADEASELRESVESITSTLDDLKKRVDQREAYSQANEEHLGYIIAAVITASVLALVARYGFGWRL